MPAARHSRAKPRQASLIGMAVPGNYLNNIDSDELLRHLAVGSPEMAAAGTMIEAAVDSIRSDLEEKLDTETTKAKEILESALTSIEDELDDALNEVEMERFTPEEFYQHMRKMSRAIRLMINDHDEDGPITCFTAVQRVKKEDEAKAAEAEKKAAVEAAPKPKRVTRTRVK